MRENGNMKSNSLNDRQRSLSRGGFSLLELMIVVVLIAGVMAIAWPSISRPMKKAELSEATHKLREAIEDGRYQAMMSGEPVFLQITQGDSELRSGGINALINGDLSDETDTLDPAATPESKLIAPPKGLQQLVGNEDDSLSGHAVTARVWKLPENIVVTSVQWMDEESEEGSYSASETSVGTDNASANDYGLGAHHNGSYAGSQSADEMEAESGSQERWCLPMTSQGRGRDAEITLLDKRARQTVTVSFTAATGELEIVR